MKNIKSVPCTQLILVSLEHKNLHTVRMEPCSLSWRLYCTLSLQWPIFKLRHDSTWTNCHNHSATDPVIRQAFFVLPYSIVSVNVVMRPHSILSTANALYLYTSPVGFRDWILLLDVHAPGREGEKDRQKIFKTILFIFSLGIKMMTEILPTSIVRPLHWRWNPLTQK